MESTTTVENTTSLEGEIIDIAEGFKSLYNSFVVALPNILVALVITLVFILIARFIRSIARAAMAKTSTEGHVDILVAQIAYIGTLTVGIIISLSILGANLTALFTSLGVAGFAVGFAMKDILGNFMSGIILLTQRQFTIGDNIIIGDVEGTVTNIRVRDTQITTYDGRLIYVPNNTLSTSNIINLTAFPKRRADVNVGISYKGDIPAAIKICLDAVAKVEGITKDPAPEGIVNGFADSSVTLQIRAWVDQKNYPYLQVKSEVHRAVKQALDDGGIEIPFPIRTVYFYSSNDSEPGIDRAAVEHPISNN